MNERRRNRGAAALNGYSVMHFGQPVVTRDDAERAATDMIADVMHATAVHEIDPDALLLRAKRTYEGDLE